ncbi:MAG: MCE family protein [Rhodospirillales bacterium]|nr:MCE family protein [Rhodospirillales bacterium]
MKNIRLNYTIVGSFVIAVLVCMVIAVALLTGRTGATDEYYAVYENVTGIKFGTRVLYEGFPIGQVEKVNPVETDGRVRFRVDMSITEGWKVPTDSTAEIVSSGLLAAVTVNLHAGKNSDLLKPGAKIDSIEGANLLQSVSDLARDVRQLTETDIKPMIAKISGAFAGFTDILGENGSSMAKDVQAMVQNLSNSTPQIIDNIERFSANLDHPPSSSTNY